MASSTSWGVLADLSEDQGGLFTRRQAESAGMAWSTLSRMASDGRLQRMGHGVYRLRGAPEVDHLQLRVAWLQLNPTAPTWERSTDSGVVSHRSAASLYGLGHLPADVHEFTLPVRRQSRRSDVRLHRGRVRDGEWFQLRGLLVTRPARIAADLLADGEDPQAVAHVIADTLREAKDYPATTAVAIARHADRHGLRAGDGPGLLAWLLDLTGDPNRKAWLRDARETVDHGARV